ncbi:MAG: DEAD/DEAH box helicase [Opitutaceae bacterium]|nr:DEAD/DEAH box helicase [Opitutaceae bacterium]
MLRKLISKLRHSLSKGGKAKTHKTKPAAKHSGHPTVARAERQRRARDRGRPAERPAHAPKSSQARTTHPVKTGKVPTAAQHHHVARPHTAAEPPAPARPLPEVPKLKTPFTALGLGDRLAYAAQQMGYVEPTPIQQQAVPLVLTGRDAIGSAQTGTGKTAAFALPILQRLGRHGALRCLVLEPTRELALQVEEAFKNFAKYTDLRATVVYGGVGYGKQREDLRHGMDILVATPGRLLDLMEQGDVNLKGINVLVLDEVDRMLDMGFLPDVKRIVQKCPRERQTMLFTATLPPEIEQLAGWVLRDPATVSIGRQRSAAETVAHAFYPVVGAQKFDLLQHLLQQTNYESVLIFSRTKAGADYVASRLLRAGHKVAVMHSDRNQAERTEALRGFKTGKYEVLVATDVAARGLDIAGISHVINYDVPENPEDYVHRIGRTGRAQNTGDAFTLVTEETWRDARSVERFIGMSIEWKKVPGFDYTYSGIFDGGGMSGTGTSAAKPASRLHRGMRGKARV